jgi:AcrR family transcriptional regulator
MRRAFPKGSFYNYFESKEDYAVQALHFYHQHLKDQLLVVLKDSSMPPKERVKAFLPAIFRCWKAFIIKWDAWWVTSRKRWAISATGWPKPQTGFYMKSSETLPAAWTRQGGTRRRQPAAGRVSCQQFSGSHAADEIQPQQPAAGVFITMMNRLLDSPVSELKAKRPGTVGNSYFSTT